MNATNDKASDELKAAIAKNLHRLMARTGFERQALADKCNMGVTTISQLLNATTNNPKPSTIKRLADGMGVDVDEFYK